MLYYSDMILLCRTYIYIIYITNERGREREKGERGKPRNIVARIYLVVTFNQTVAGDGEQMAFEGPFCDAFCVLLRGTKRGEQ